MIIFLILAVTFFTNTFAQCANQLLIDNNCYSQEQICKLEDLKIIIDAAKVYEGTTLTRTALVEAQERTFSLNVQDFNDQITKAKSDLLKCATFDEASRANVEKTQVILSFSQTYNSTIVFLNACEEHKKIHEICQETNIIVVILGLGDCYCNKKFEDPIITQIISILAIIAKSVFDEGKALVNEIQNQEITTTWAIQNNILEVSCTGSQGLTRKESFKLTELPLDAEFFNYIEKNGAEIIQLGCARDFCRRLNILTAQTKGLDYYIQALEQEIKNLFTYYTPAQIREVINKSILIPADNVIDTLAMIKLVKNGIIGLDEKAENIILKETNQPLSTQAFKDLLYPLVEEIKLPSLPEDTETNTDENELTTPTE